MGPLTTANVAAPNARATPQRETGTSYRRIFKSTALIGGTQSVNVLIGIVRTKLLALLLGTSGMGLAGLYLSATSLIASATSFGIGQSGVRQIAAVAGTGNSAGIARTATVLRRASLASGLLGMLAVLVFCKPLSRVTFGTGDYAGGLALVSLTLLFGGLSGGQSALMQGMRRLRDMAAGMLLGSALGALAAIVIVYFMREKGVALFLMASSGIGTLLTWYYSRRIRIPSVSVSLRETVAELKGLLGLGLALLAGSLMSAGLNYGTRVLVVRDLGMDKVGLYAAAWTLSSYYVNMILGAMATDFYPRLTSVAGDNATVNRLVNEQAQMGMLIAMPGVIGSLTIAPWLIHLFYSAAFIPATDVMRWQIVGVALRVISFPLGYVQLAMGRARLFVLTNGITFTFQLGLVIGCLKLWRLEGVGIAFMLTYAFYTVFMTCVCRRLSGFTWSGGNRHVMLLGGVAVAATVFTVYRLPLITATIVGAMLALAAAVYSMVQLRNLLQVNPLAWLAGRLGVTRKHTPQD
jgi:PST family polysaccharide transporter